MSGKFISDESPSPDKSEIDVSLLPAGMYVMRVETEEDVFVKRFIKN
ncbi:MAG: T9SS type A sorting domain-containing protein [Saprospiraceae bacterium]|nr:T9SS type A sorting domain-containing protein [Saprospiraceae bacterium]